MWNSVRQYEETKSSTQKGRAMVLQYLTEGRMGAEVCDPEKVVPAKRPADVSTCSQQSSLSLLKGMNDCA